MAQLGIHFATVSVDELKGMGFRSEFEFQTALERCLPGFSHLRSSPEMDRYHHPEIQIWVKDGTGIEGPVTLRGPSGKSLFFSPKLSLSTHLYNPRESPALKSGETSVSPPASSSRLNIKLLLL